MRANSGMPRIGWAAAGLVAGILIGLFAGWARWSWTSGSIPRQTVDAPVLLHEIQRLSELVTVKFTVEKVVGLEEKKQPLGSEKLLLFVQADVLAGVDLSKVTQKRSEDPAGEAHPHRAPSTSYREYRDRRHADESVGS